MNLQFFYTTSLVGRSAKPINETIDFFNRFWTCFETIKSGKEQPRTQSFYEISFLSVLLSERYYALLTSYEKVFFAHVSLLFTIYGSIFHFV